MQSRAWNDCGRTVRDAHEVAPACLPGHRIPLPAHRRTPTTDLVEQHLAWCQVRGLRRRPPPVEDALNEQSRPARREAQPLTLSAASRDPVACDGQLLRTLPASRARSRRSAHRSLPSTPLSVVSDREPPDVPERGTRPSLHCDVAVRQNAGRSQPRAGDAAETHGYSAVSNQLGLNRSPHHRSCRAYGRSAVGAIRPRPARGSARRGSASPGSLAAAR